MPSRTSTSEDALAASAALVSGTTLLSRVLGFLRDMAIAFILGASPAADAFVVAFRLPNLMRRLFGEGSLTMAFVPAYSHLFYTQGAAPAHAMARSCQAWLLAVLAAASIVVLFLANPLAALLAPGFANQPELLGYTANLIRICFPYTVFICSVALAMGVLNASGRFLGPALAPCVLNLILTAVALTAPAVGWDPGKSLAWAVLLAGAPQWLLQQPFLAAAGFSWRGFWKWRDAGAAKVGKLLAPTLLGAAAYQLVMLLITAFASILDAGSVAHLYYAERVAQFPLGVFALAVSTAALPALSQLAGAGQWTRFSETVESSIRLSMCLSLPAAVGLAALSGPIVSVLFGRGAFSPQDVQAAATALLYFSLGVPAAALSRPLVSAFYAQGKTAAPTAASLASLATAAILCLALFPWGHAGLALASSLALWSYAGVLWLLLRRTGTFQGFSRQGRRSLVLGLAFSMAMGGAICCVLFLAPGISTGQSLLLIPPAAFGYGAAAWAAKLPEVRLLWGVFFTQLRHK